MDWKNILSSKRAIVTAVVSVAVVVVSQTMGIEIDEATKNTIVTSLVLWIAGESAGASQGWNALIANPKFVVLVGSVVNALFKDKLGIALPPEMIQTILTLIQTLLAGYALRPHIAK
jgi:hypothetical protein